MEPSDTFASASPPPATAKVVPASSRRSVSALWLIPLLAVLAAGVLIYQAFGNRGPLITIRFANGEGLRPTDPVSYRGVQVGEVRSITLAPDLSGIVVEAELARHAAALAVEGSKFWIVRPEVSLTRVSGLDTLLGPRYIEVSPGPPTSTGNAVALTFDGMSAPARTNSTESANASSTAPAALEIILLAPTRGSVTVDAPIAYRDVRIGSVVKVELAATAKDVEITARIDGTHAHLVRANSRFWNASGIGLDVGLLKGLSLKTGSLESLLAGGIAFATPTKAGDAAKTGDRFALEAAVDEDWLKWTPDLQQP